MNSRAAIRVFLVVLSLGMMAGCASGPDSSAAEDADASVAETENSVDQAPSAVEIPMVLDSDEDLTQFSQSFSAFVDGAALLHEDLIVGSLESEAARIEQLRGDLDRWRTIQAQVQIDSDSAEMSVEAFERFVDRINGMNDRLRRVVFQINREIAEATGAAPESDSS